MVYYTKRADRRVVAAIKTGGIGVLPTDTIYGLVGSALNKKTVERIYKLRRRNPKKPMIISIGSLGDLGRFGVKPDKKMAHFLKSIWLRSKVLVLFSNSRELENRPASVILPLSPNHYSLTTKLNYLHRGTKSLAFRLPKPYWLRRLLAKVGPLVAPSANPEGKPPAKTIKEARKYFGDKADFYVDGGRIIGRPSKLVQITEGKIKILRK